MNRFEEWQSRKGKKILHSITYIIIVGGTIGLLYILPVLFKTGNILDKIVGGIFSSVILIIFGIFLTEIKNDF